MLHLSHNYTLGLVVLVFAFLFFYAPMVYAFFKIRNQQRNQNK